MDIFEIAQQGIKIQEDEEKVKIAEEAATAKSKTYKIDVKEAIAAASSKDYDWFNRLGENQKSFQPFMINMWMSQIWAQNTNRAFTGNDEFYASIVRDVNLKLNTDIFNVSKEMFWLLACTVQQYINFEYDATTGKRKRLIDQLEFKYKWVKSTKKTAAEKYNKKVIDYMATELYSSSEKIMDMIDNKLITSEDMKEIEKDLATLEDQSKKKK
jgi:hypothetical protein